MRVIFQLLRNDVGDDRIADFIVTHTTGNEPTVEQPEEAFRRGDRAERRRGPSQSVEVQTKE